MSWTPPNSRLSFEPPDLLIPELHMLGYDHFTEAVRTLGAHTHPGAWEICYLLRGSVEWWADQSLVEVRGGDVYLTRPDQPHGGVDAMMHPNELVWLQVKISPDMTGLTSGEAKELQKRFDGLKLLSFKGNESLQRMYFELLSHHERPRELSALACRSILYQLLLTVLDCHDRQLANDQDATSPKLKRALAWIDEHLEEDHSVEQIAAQVDLSPSHFHDLFLKQTGFTPADYRQRQRINRARELLRSTDQTITQIAHQLGFSTSQYFSTVFKKMIGLTPRAYRGRTD